MLADYRTTSLSVGVHPMELLRAHLPAGVLSSRDLETARDRSQVAVAGMAVARQRPATANGVVFMLIEDEFGAVNLIVPPTVYDLHRAIVRGEPLILAHGLLERIERNQNVLVRSARSHARSHRRPRWAPASPARTTSVIARTLSSPSALRAAHAVPSGSPLPAGRG